MKAKVLVLSLAAVLASCAGNNNHGTKVEQSKFMEKCATLEDHAYAKATVKIKGTHKEAGEEVQINYEFKYVWDTNRWKGEGSLPTDLTELEYFTSAKQQISFTLKDMVATYDPEDELPEGYDYSFYINPFRVVSEITNTAMHSKGEMRYNKYGYMTYQKSKIEYNTGKVQDFVATCTYANA